MKRYFRIYNTEEEYHQDPPEYPTTVFMKNGTIANYKHVFNEIRYNEYLGETLYDQTFSPTSNISINDNGFFDFITYYQLENNQYNIITNNQDYVSNVELSYSQLSNTFINGYGSALWIGNYGADSNNIDYEINNLSHVGNTYSRNGINDIPFISKYSSTSVYNYAYPVYYIDIYFNGVLQNYLNYPYQKLFFCEGMIYLNKITSFFNYINLYSNNNEIIYDGVFECVNMIVDEQTGIENIGMSLRLDNDSIDTITTSDTIRIVIKKCNSVRQFYKAIYRFKENYNNGDIQTNGYLDYSIVNHSENFILV